MSGGHDRSRGKRHGRARAALAVARPLIEREARSKALDEVMKALAASDAAYNIAAPIVHALKEKPHA